MSMSLISTVTVGSGGASSIEFTSIPQDGTDLLVLISARIDVATVQFETLFRLNGDTSNIYFWRNLTGNGSTVSSTNDVSTSRIPLEFPGSSATSNTFGNLAIYVSNYTGTTNKSISVDNVLENNATAARQFLIAGRYANTTGITSLSFNGNGNNFSQNSVASLYKITKGSDGIVTTS